MDREERGAEGHSTELLARREQHVAQRSAPLVHRPTRADLARQREPVRVQPARWKPDESVAFAHALWPKDLRAVDDTHEKAGEVVRVGRVHPGHLRGLSADERRTQARAGIGHRPDDAGKDGRIDLRRREVVEEEERLRAHCERIVHAVVDEVGANDLVTVEKSREV